MLTHARNAGTCLTLSHQDLSQLQPRGVGLLQTIRTSTAHKVWCSVRNPEMCERVARILGQVMYANLSWTQHYDPKEDQIHPRYALRPPCP